MVLYWIFEQLAAFFATVAGLLPDVPVPGWVAETSGWRGTLGSALRGIGSWVPLGLTVAVIGAYLLCVGVSLGLKMARIVASFLTAGGGSAA